MGPRGGFQHPMARPFERRGQTGAIIVSGPAPVDLSLWNTAVHSYKQGLHLVAHGRSREDFKEAANDFLNAAITFEALVPEDPTRSQIAQQIVTIHQAITVPIGVDVYSAQKAATIAYELAHQYLVSKGKTPMYRQGQWIRTTRFPLTLVGLGEVPPAYSHGRWWSKSKAGYFTFTGLGDTASDWNAGEVSYNQGQSDMSQASSATDDTQKISNYNQAVSDFLTAANDYLAVANDASNTTAASSIQSAITAIQQAQSGASGTTDVSTASAAASLAQANATTARVLAQSIAGSNKAQPSGGGGSTDPVKTSGGGGTTQQPPTGMVTCPAGTPNAGQVVSNLSMCGTAPVTTPVASSKSWLPWAVAGGILVGGGAIAYALHKKKGRKGHRA